MDEMIKDMSVEEEINGCGPDKKFGVGKKFKVTAKMKQSKNKEFLDAFSPAHLGPLSLLVNVLDPAIAEFSGRRDIIYGKESKRVSKRPDTMNSFWDTCHCGSPTNTYRGVQIVHDYWYYDDSRSKRKETLTLFLANRSITEAHAGRAGRAGFSVFQPLCNLHQYLRIGHRLSVSRNSISHSERLVTSLANYLFQILSFILGLYIHSI
jgi:hypothetical protein